MDPIVAILLIALVLMIPVLMLYVMYRIGLYVALNFTKVGRSIPSEDE